MIMRTITLIIIHCSATPEGRGWILKLAAGTTSATGASRT